MKNSILWQKILFSLLQCIVYQFVELQLIQRITFTMIQATLQRFPSHSHSGSLLLTFLGRYASPAHSSIQNLTKSSVLSFLICGTLQTATSSKFSALIKRVRHSRKYCDQNLLPKAVEDVSNEICGAILIRGKV